MGLTAPDSAYRQVAALVHNIQALERRIAQMDDEIDLRVYELYGLTEEEIRVVEGK
jgi:hypothetical protein